MSEHRQDPALAPASVDRGANEVMRRPSESRDPKARRIGVYVCHCGGNISDYVDVQAVVDAVKDEQSVVVAKHMMFACSDAGQQEMEDDIAASDLDGLVVASCSPKLHVVTFRGVAKRSGMNPYEYNQTNIR